MTVTLTIGDYISYGSGSMGKILGIFLHQLTSRPRRVFLYIQPIHSCSTARDEILDLPLLKLDIVNDEVIGLSAVDKTKLFMVPVSTSARKDGKSGLDITLRGDSLIHCTWDVEFF
jgi:hypothetical protein